MSAEKARDQTLAGVEKLREIHHVLSLLPDATGEAYATLYQVYQNHPDAFTGAQLDRLQEEVQGQIVNVTASVEAIIEFFIGRAGRF